MNIIETKFSFNGEFLERLKTEMIVLHHRAGTGDVLSIHRQHIKEGSNGIGYHFYIRRDGKVYRGRPVEVIGAHTKSFNSNSIGICFEGDFTKESMKEKQLAAGRELLRYIKSIYGDLPCYRHSDLASTLCPGEKFPFYEIAKISSDEVVERMYVDGVTSIENVKNWETFLTSDYCPSKYVREIFKRYQERMRK